MRSPGLIAASVVGALLALEGAALAQVELKNDGFVDGANVGFQQGFASGEMGASRFTPPMPGVLLQKVQFLFGGGTTTPQDIKLHVWDDAAETTDPGAELFSGDYTLVPADDQLQEIDITAEGVTVTGTFRVGIEFTHVGLPSIARDDDTTIAVDKNFIFAQGGLGWAPSADLGLTGDWVIRAIVEGEGGNGGSGPGSTSTTGSGPSGGGGFYYGECFGNDDCDVGTYCSVIGACTFDCRNDTDCDAGDRCNSLGRCVDAALPDDGCGLAPHGGSDVAWAMLVLAALAGAARRRNDGI